jgi:hypothetical protein
LDGCRLCGASGKPGFVDEVLCGGQGLGDLDKGSSAIESCFSIVDAPRRLLLEPVVVGTPKPPFVCMSPPVTLVEANPVGRRIKNAHLNKKRFKIK